MKGRATNKVVAGLLVVVSVIAGATVANPQEVAEIPFWHQPPGSAGLGGGIRLGQSPYLASDNEDDRQIDLIPSYSGGNMSSGQAAARPQLERDYSARQQGAQRTQNYQRQRSQPQRRR